MAFGLEWSDRAIRDLQTLQRDTSKRIIDKIEWIAKQDNPLRHAVILHDARIGDIRFRIGDYRAVACVNHAKKKITIAAVGHRREIYR